MGAVPCPDAILVTGGAGFIGSHIVDALVSRGPRRPGARLARSAVHAARPDYLESGRRVDRGRRRPIRPRSRSALRGVDAVCHQAAMVGLGLDIADMRRLRPRQRPRDRGPAPASWRPAGLSRPPRARQQHGRLRRGRLPLREHGTVAPAAASPPDLRGRTVRAALPALVGGRSAPQAITEDGARSTPATSTPRRRSTRSICASRSRARPASR